MVGERIAAVITFSMLVISSLPSITSCTSLHWADSHGHSPATDGMEVEGKIARLIRSEMERYNIRGLSIVVAQDQGIRWEQGFGQADAARNLPATPRTIFRMGSLSKLFTGIAILQMAEQGKINLDAPVQTYLPKLTVRSRFQSTPPITARNLLSHHSGLPANHLKDMFTWQPPGLCEVVDRLNGQTLAFRPDSVYSYSNRGFGLLGCLVETISGAPFEGYMEESVLRPMGMADSGFLLNPRMTDLLALGYIDGKAISEAPFGPLSAGSLLSNATDMGRFMTSLESRAARYWPAAATAVGNRSEKTFRQLCIQRPGCRNWVDTKW